MFTSIIKEFWELKQLNVEKYRAAKKQNCCSQRIRKNFLVISIPHTGYTIYQLLNKLWISLSLTQ